jgi:hypothetical protein
MCALFLRKAEGEDKAKLSLDAAIASFSCPKRVLVPVAAWTILKLGGA